VIQPVGLRVLERLGLGDAARDLGAPISAMLGHTKGRARDRVVLDVAYRPGAPGLVMHRGALFEILWQAVLARGVPVHTGEAVIAAPLAPGLPE
jgi:2-polyprenyl-6-methoxyphenol hydroxylase-like FAD-dependent oxidoreductase